MVAPALLALALGALGVVAVPLEGPLVSLSASDAVVRMPFKVTCSIKRAVPATNVTITANNRTWPVTLSQDGHQATAEVTVQNKGNVQLGCTVHMGSRKLQTNATVQVFYLPVPLLAITDTTKAGTELRGLCSLPAGAPRGVWVRVLATGRGDQGNFKKPPVPFSLLVQEEDAERGLEVTCEAKMYPDPPRNKSQRIRVLVKPRLDMELCPPQQNWTEGQDGILNCSAKGTPKPQVNCSKDGNFLTPGKSHPINRAHAGTYLCRATNDLGTAERNVTVWVQYDTSVPLLPVILWTVLPVAVILSLVGLFLFFCRGHTQKIGEYWLGMWERMLDVWPLRPQGSYSVVLSRFVALQAGRAHGEAGTP